MCCLSCGNDDDEILEPEYGGAIYRVEMHVSDIVGDIGNLSQITVEAYDFNNEVPLYDNLKKETHYSSYQGTLTKAIDFTTERPINYFKACATLFSVDPIASAQLHYKISKDSLRVFSGTFELDANAPSFMFRSYIPLFQK